MFDQDAIDRYRDVIGYVAAETRRQYRGEYEWGELYALVLHVASDRYRLWDAGTFPPGRDLAIHVHREIRTDRYARGWRQVGSGKSRRWVRPDDQETPLPYQGRAYDPYLWVVTWEPYRVLFGDDDGGTYRLLPWWPKFTPGQRRKFARLIERWHPGVVAAFEAIDREQKPPRTTKDRWARNRMALRRQLWITYQDELDEVMFAVTRGGRSRKNRRHAA